MMVDTKYMEQVLDALANTGAAWEKRTIVSTMFQAKTLGAVTVVTFREVKDNGLTTVAATVRRYAEPEELCIEGDIPYASYCKYLEKLDAHEVDKKKQEEAATREHFEKIINFKTE